MNAKTGRPAVTTGAARAPRADGQRTRQALIDAAVGLFAEASLEATSVRAIGAAAHVDPALIARYFGSKESLFVAALESIRDSFDVDDIFAGPTDEQGMALARYILVAHTEPHALAMVLRAASSPTTSALVAEHLTDRIQVQIRAGLSGRNKAARASTIMAIITGATTVQLLYNMEQTHSSSFVRLIGASIQDVIDAGGAL